MVSLSHIDLICNAVLAAILLASCTHEERLSKPPVLRIIVKFTDSAQRLPNTLSTRWASGVVLLRHERALSGESHLYTGRVPKAAIRRVVRILNKRPDVNYVQADRKLEL